MKTAPYGSQQDEPLRCAHDSLRCAHDSLPVPEGAMAALPPPSRRTDPTPIIARHECQGRPSSFSQTMQIRGMVFACNNLARAESVSRLCELHPMWTTATALGSGRQRPDKASNLSRQPSGESLRARPQHRVDRIRINDCAPRVPKGRILKRKARSRAASSSARREVLRVGLA